MQGTTQVENQSIPLILLTGSAHFVEKLNINCESWTPIGWINKSDNSIGNDQSAGAAQTPIKAGFWHQNFHSEPSF